MSNRRMNKKGVSVLGKGAMFFLLFVMLSVPVYALELKAFGDITFGDTTKDNEVSGFSLGQLDLWATHRIDQEGKVKTFLELVIEHNGEGFIVDLERLWVAYSVIPEVQIRGGRFHTALGYWNRVHHHGAHMQTTVGRPLFLDFEDGTAAIFPTHTIGAMLVADASSSIGGLHLEVQFGNGTSYNSDSGELDPHNIGDSDEGKGVASRLAFTPGAIEGLGFGFSFSGSSVKDSGLGTKIVDQKIYEADLFYLENSVEFIFEHYWVRNEDTSNVTRTSTAWYVQGGYNLFDLVTPYVRFESLDDVDTAADPYFAGLGTTEYHQTVFGARFDIVTNSSIKIEGRFLDEFVAGASESYWLQWTFGF